MRRIALFIPILAVLTGACGQGGAVVVGDVNQTVPPPKYPAHFSGLPPVGAHYSMPADGRLVLNISPQSGPQSGESWNVYADGRMIRQRHGANFQQRLTPQGVQVLRSRILAIAQPTGLFKHSLRLGSKAFGGWYEVRADGHLVDTWMGDPSDFNHPPRMATPAQMRALARINALVANTASRLPAGAWADRTINPYVPPLYELGFDRFAPDPAKLPSPAGEALAQFQPLLRHACQVVTTDQARALIAAFVKGAVELESNRRGEVNFNVPAVGRGHHTILEFRPDLPVDRRALRTGSCE